MEALDILRHARESGLSRARFLRDRLDARLCETHGILAAFRLICRLRGRLGEVDDVLRHCVYRVEQLFDICLHNAVLTCQFVQLPGCAYNIVDGLIDLK